MLRVLIEAKGLEAARVGGGVGGGGDNGDTERRGSDSPGNEMPTHDQIIKTRQNGIMCANTPPATATGPLFPKPQRVNVHHVLDLSSTTLTGRPRVAATGVASLASSFAPAAFSFSSLDSPPPNRARKIVPT